MCLLAGNDQSRLSGRLQGLGARGFVFSDVTEIDSKFVSPDRCTVHLRDVDLSCKALSVFV